MLKRFEHAQGAVGDPVRTATVVNGDAEAAALDELRVALQRSPPEVPCKYFYDDRGSALFEQITRLPEYYPTRTERALLLEQARPIVEAAGGARLSEMVELGSGAASKTVALLEAALRLRSHLAPGDLLLLGANLVTDPAVIHEAYNDRAGVTAEFNRNILRSVNTLAGSAFDPQKFEHYAPYLVDRQRIEMWLVAREPLEIDLGRIGGRLTLAPWQGIRTEISRRFTREQVLHLLEESGFSPDRWFESPDGRFGLALGRARAALRGL